MGVSKECGPGGTRPLEFMVVPGNDGAPESPEVVKVPTMWGIVMSNGSLNCDGGTEI